MKHYLSMAVVALALAACSDDYDDTALWNTVNDHENRIAALEQWQDEVNNNIAALQQLLNTNDMITSVTPVMENGKEVGYTIAFLHSDPVTIYNGTQGEKGEAGDTPQIGLTQDEDGNWYWTLNGELMCDAEGNPIRANGEDGEDGQDGQAGQDGADGEDGSDGSTGPQGPAGEDAPTPQIKLGKEFPTGTEIDGEPVEATAWYLSVDNGKTWHRVSGEDGKDGTNGDSMFSDKPKVDEENGKVIFYLSGGAEIEVPLYQGITITFTSSDKNPIDPNEPITVTGSTLEISYTVNGITDPRIVAIPSAKGWSATVSGTTITVKVETGAASECDLLVTATDNAGKSVSYTLSLQYDYLVDEDTYIVTNETGLKAWAEAVQNDLSLNCTLTADITLTGEWTPIGTDYRNSYTGTFDGGGNTITGLTVTGSNEYAGLFGRIGSGGTVKNVVLKDVQITSDNQYANVGGVAGWSFGNIEYCSVSGSVSGSGMNGNAGGVVGSQYKGSIIGCSSSAIVNAGSTAGGVAGATNNGATLTACYATGSVSVENNATNAAYAGGVVGNNGGFSTLQACYAWGSVTGSGSVYVGGVTGSNDASTLQACYHAKGAVSGPNGTTGGVAGRNFKDSMFGGGIITACYWGSNPDTGIGYNEGGSTTIETTKVTDGDWTEAMNAMNNALSGTSWKYVSGSGNEPLMLQKVQ